MAKSQDDDEPDDDEEWYADYDNIKWLGKALVDADYIEDKAELQFYYDKPWKWNAEWAAWAELGNPGVNDKNWNAFIDALNEIK